MQIKINTGLIVDKKHPLWYADHMGEIFEVTGEVPAIGTGTTGALDGVYLVETPDGTTGGVWMRDCEVLPEEYGDCVSCLHAEEDEEEPQSACYTCRWLGTGEEDNYTPRDLVQQPLKKAGSPFTPTDVPPEDDTPQIADTYIHCEAKQYHFIGKTTTECLKRIVATIEAGGVDYPINGISFHHCSKEPGGPVWEATYCVEVD